MMKGKALLSTLFNPQLKLFTLTLLYYLSLYFSINNRMLLLVSLIYLALVYLHLKNIKLALFLVFLATLPFAKGKAFQIVLLPKEQITHWAFFKISYSFPVYLSDFFLVLLFYFYLRSKLARENQIFIPYRLKISLFLFLVFTMSILLNAINHIYSEVIILSVAHLIKLLVVLFLPFISMPKNKNDYSPIYLIASASLIFQSLWVFLQRINQGPLGRDIEGVIPLPGIEFGIRSSENAEFLRSSGTFFEPSILGTFLLIHLTLIIFVLLRQKRLPFFQRRIYLISFTLGIFALVFTGSRALYLFATLIALIIFYLHKEKVLGGFQKNKKIIFLGSSIALILLVPFITSRLTSLPDLFTAYGSGTYRLQMIEYAFRLAQEKPFLGVGLNLSPYFLATAFPQERFIFDPTFPHNLFSQLLAETGIVGLALFLMLLYSLLRPMFSKNAKFHLNEFGWAALVFLLCAQVYPIFLNQPEISSFLFLYLGLSVYKNIARKTNV